MPWNNQLTVNNEPILFSSGIFTCQFCFYGHVFSNNDSAFSNPTHASGPNYFLWQGKYYAFGTSSENGILAYTSGDLIHWKPIESNNGFALKKGDAFGTKGFWAPQVFDYKGKFYMAYVANENIAIATSDQPDGPFTQINKESLPAPVKQIDPFVFIDDDGKNIYTMCGF